MILLFLGNVIFGGIKKFSHYWALILYGGMIAALGTLITSALAHYKGDLASAQIGLGIFTAGNPESALHKIATPFNVFTIWEAIVIGIGLAVFTKSSKSATITTMILLYLVLGIGSAFVFGYSII